MDERWLEYCRTGKYRGFLKVTEKNYKMTFRTHLKFSNGKKEIFASGNFKEEAFSKAFDSIDRYISKDYSTRSR